MKALCGDNAHFVNNFLYGVGVILDICALCAFCNILYVISLTRWSFLRELKAIINIKGRPSLSCGSIGLLLSF